MASRPPPRPDLVLWGPLGTRLAEVGSRARFLRGEISVLSASAVVAAAYASAGALGLWLLHHVLGPDLATIAPTLGVPWLAVGIGVAGLLVFGLRAAPGVLVGSCLTWGVMQGDPWIPVLIDATGEVASVAAIVWLLRSWDYRPSLERYQDALILVAAAAIGRLISASLDVVATFATAWFMTTPETRAILEEAGVYRDGNVFVVHPTLFAATARWWLNSTAGVVLIVPLLAALARSGARERPGSRGELLLWGCATTGWLAAAFLLPVLEPRVSLLALALVLVVWAALRFGAAVASAGTLVFSTGATIGFGLKLGAFAGIAGRESVEVAWGFIGLLVGAGLFLTPLLAGRARAQRRLLGSVERYRRLFYANPSPMWAEDPATGRIVLVNDAALRTYGYSKEDFMRLGSRGLRNEPGGTATDDHAPLPATGSYPTTHRTALGRDLDVEVTPVEVELDGATLRVSFIDVLSERNDLRLAVLSAADLERHRLGQEIRDGLGRVLARLAVRVEELAVAATCNEPIDVELARLTEADAVAASAICRQLTRGASPIHFASGDLLEALRRMPEVLVDRNGPEVSVSVRSLAPVRLSLERAEHVYRIAQDAVRAALIRPGTAHVYVAIDVTTDAITVTVDDDGATPPRAPLADRPEIWPMDVRAAAARARLEVGVLAGGGNRVHFECRQSVDQPQSADEAPSGRPMAAGALNEPSRSAPPAEPRRYAAGIRPWLDGGVLFLAYFLAGAIGLRFLEHIDSHHLALIPAVALPWVASGVAVAGLLLRGNRLAPAVFLASVAVWRGLEHDPWINVLADALGETLATVLVAELLRRYGFRAQFDRFRDLALLLGAAAIGRLVPAIFDAAGLHFAGAVAPGTLTPELLEGLSPTSPRLLGLTRFELKGYLRWWINGVAGVTLVVPVLLPISADFGRTLRRRWREASFFFAALAVTAIAIGGGPPASWRLSLLGLGVVLVAWGAVRFGVALASTATLALSLAATVGYGLGLGPVAAASPGEGPEVLWGFIGLLGATGLFLTTVVVEHEATMRGLRLLKARYEVLFEAIPRPLFALSEPAGRITMANIEALNKYGYSREELLGLDPAMLAVEPAHGGFGPDSEGSPDRAVLPRVHRTRSGEIFDVELSLTRVDLGEDIERLCFATDVTERNELRRRVLETSDLERRRLAQDLHDSLGQSLTGLHLGVASVRRTTERDGTAKVEAILFISGAIRDARLVCEQIVLGLSPLHSTDGDVIAALRRLPAQLPPGVRDRLTIEIRAETALRLPLPMREHLYQIAREAVNNSLKHAEATRISVTLIVDTATISLTIEDDGIGIHPARGRATGLGLQSLGLRATALRGRLQLQCRSGRGTTVICRCPHPAA